VQCRTELAQADDALGHHAEDRRVQARMRQTLDLVDVVVGDELARAALREVGNRLDRPQLPAVEIAIARLTGLVKRKSRVRLVADAGPDANLVDALGNRCERRIGRQFNALIVVIARHRQRIAGQRNQRVRPLEVVVLQRRLVDLRRKGDLVLAVRLHRVEMLGAIGERRIENVPPALGTRIGIVLLAVAGGQQEQQNRQEKAGKKHGPQCNAKSARWGQPAPRTLRLSDSPTAIVGGWVESFIMAWSG
jgi:hypothetical protein